MGTEEDESYGPRIEVWNYLWSAIDQSINEFRDLDPKSRKIVERIGRLLAQGRTDFVLQPEALTAKLHKAAQGLLDDVWVRHAAEIEIARLGVSRTDDALKRFLNLRPVVTPRPVPERAKRYIREVIDTYILGFDAACIALCRAACEQVLRDALVSKGVYTEPQLRRERPTAGSLMANAKRSGVLNVSIPAAEKLITKGDTVMHSFLYEERILEQQALDSVSELAQVLAEVLD